jgi:hypothetical protein
LAHKELAVVLRALQDTKGVIQHRRDVKRLAPHDLVNRFNLAMILFQTGDRAGALREAKELEPLASTNPAVSRKVSNLLGQILSGNRHFGRLDESGTIIIDTAPLPRHRLNFGRIPLAVILQVGLFGSSWWVLSQFPSQATARGQLARWLLIATIGLVAVVPGIWIQSLIATRGAALRTVRVMLASLPRSRHSLLGLLACLGFLVMQVYLLLADPDFLMDQLLFALVLIAGVAGLILLPPVALVCTASRADAASLLDTTARHLFPMRVTAFVDQGAVPEGLFWHNRLGNLRTVWGSGWQQLVKDLTARVGLIVVDCRSVSDALKEEATWVFTIPRARQRAIFLGTDAGELPLLDQLQGVPAKSELTVASLASLPFTIDQLLSDEQPH